MDHCALPSLVLNMYAANLFEQFLKKSAKASVATKLDKQIPSEIEVALLHKEHQETLGSSWNIWTHLGTSRNIL